MNKGFAIQAWNIGKPTPWLPYLSCQEDKLVVSYKVGCAQTILGLACIAYASISFINIPKNRGQSCNVGGLRKNYLKEVWSICAIKGLTLAHPQISSDA